MLENIDLLKIEEDLKKQRLARFLKNKRNIADISFVLAGEVSSIAQSFPTNLFIHLAISIFLLDLFTNWKNNYYISKEILTLLRETDEYKECQKLYNEFIKRTANFIRYMGYSDSKEAVLYFDVLQTAGILSQDTENTYHNYKYDKVFATELLGARMVSGKCVCRHYASFAADLFNELDMVASPLIVRTKKDCNPEKKLHNPFLDWTHAAVGIVAGQEKYLYDPTCSLFFGASNFEFKDERYSNYVAKPVVESSSLYYLIYPGEKLAFNKNYRKISYAIGALPMQAISQEEIKYLKRKVEENTTRRLADITYFHQANKKIMKELAELEYAISPHSDKEINKWVLTKTK